MRGKRMDFAFEFSPVMTLRTFQEALALVGPLAAAGAPPGSPRAAADGRPRRSRGGPERERSR